MIMHNKKTASKFWLVVWSSETGDFRNATMESITNETIDEIAKRFESENEEYRVIHIGEGELPPKTYRSLEYLN